MSKEFDLGKEGEEVATFYLMHNGFKILDRNWRFNKYELDIIASKDNLIIIVEVKTRADEFFERPQDAVTLKKQKFMYDAAEAYLEAKDISKELRFDIISIILSDKKNSIDHIEGAFRPGW